MNADIEEEENILLMKKAQNRLKKKNSEDLIPIEDAFKEAGWNDKEQQSSSKY
jgi:hypothetical protein